MISLAKNLGADIATAFVAKDAFDPRARGIKVFELFRETIWTKIPGFRYVQVQLAFLLKTGFAKNYDVIIYSGDCLIALVRHLLKHGWPASRSTAQPFGSVAPAGAAGEMQKHFADMPTPPRHLYDAYKERLREYVLWKKIIFIPFAAFNRWRFKFLSKRLDVIVTNSKNTQARIKQCLGLDSVVVYPPCDTLPFRNLLNDDRALGRSHPPTPLEGGFTNGEYFFSWARLYPIKRVDQIVEAFIGMPDKKLIVASGGPDLEKIKKMAEGHANITILGWIDDNQLLEYLGKCLATIYIPIREDFGMSVVESMQAGKPVIGVAEGGLLEIIENNKNGILLQPNFTTNDLQVAVKQMNTEFVQSTEQNCYNTAAKFSEQNFINEFKKAANLL